MVTPQIILGQPSPDDDRPGLLVRTHYAEGFISDLKSTVPWGDRRWYPPENAWWVAEDHFDYVADLTVHHFGAVEIVDEDGAITTRSPGGTSVQERLL